jgi:2-polyprenyl-6-methoxyphenol hydroxylase-like FAD-dependent oxidoreductase
MTHTHRAIVIGGGIAGPALSLFLTRSGIVPQIFEAYPAPSTIGGAFQIAPNGMRVMAALGLADRVAAAGAPSSTFDFRNHHGRTIGHMNLRRSGIGVTILRADFHRLLVEEAARQGVSMAYNKRLDSIEDRGAEVVAHFEDGSTASGDVLIAADGVNSRVRALILPEQAQARYTGMLGVGGFAAGGAAPADARDADQLNFVVGPRLQFGYANLSATSPRWGWWCHLPQEPELPRRQLQAITNDEMRARVFAAFRGWHPPVEALIAATDEIMRTAIYDVPTLPTWHVGRVMLIGDAAHAMSPAGGQGASLALEDAMLLGQRLARSSASIEQVLADVESQLRPRAERIVAQAVQNDARQLKELGTVGCWIRDRLFPVFVPLIARELERQYGAMRSASAEAA